MFFVILVIMKTILFLAMLLVAELLFLLSPWSPQVFENRDDVRFEKEISTKDINYTFTLKDFYANSPVLDTQVDAAYKKLSKRQRVAELLMPAVGSNGLPVATVEKMIATDAIGGFMLLGKGVSKADIERLKQKALLYKDVPLLVSIDAEPSLVSSRLPAIGQVGKTSSYTTKESVQSVAGTISSFIKEYGFSVNFAPVYDINKNKAVIGSRSHGSTTKSAANLADAFSEVSMNMNVVPVAKHFPGHGNVIGDSHKLLPIISSDLVELDSFRSAIDMGIPMIMTGHLAVEGGKYDTGGKPATLSSVIQKDLLRDELGFEGVVITDAFNMHALKGFRNNELESLKAGADIILMPQTASTQIIESVLREAQSDPIFEKELEEKVKRVLRLKFSIPNL